jgi:hypothetical protein
MAATYIAAIDHGTTSTRCILFTRDDRHAAIAQREQSMFYPQPGWVELDMGEVWQRTQECIHDALLRDEGEAYAARLRAASHHHLLRRHHPGLHDAHRAQQHARNARRDRASHRRPAQQPLAGRICRRRRACANAPTSRCRSCCARFQHTVAVIRLIVSGVALVAGLAMQTSRRDSAAPTC